MQKFLISMSLTEGELECKPCRYATIEPSSLDCSRTIPLCLDCRICWRAVWTPRHAIASCAYCAREVQVYSPVFTGITHCNDAFCVCENDHPATREWDVLSWASHTQTDPSTRPNYLCGSIRLNYEIPRSLVELPQAALFSFSARYKPRK